MVALAAVAADGLPIVLAPMLAAAATVAASVHPLCVAACTARLVPDTDLQRANALRAGIGQAAIVGVPPSARSCSSGSRPRSPSCSTR